MRAKAIIFALLVILLTSIAFSASEYPHFSFKTLDGNTITSRSLRGKAVFLTFFFRSCKPCKEEVPVLKELMAKYGDTLAVLGVGFMENDSAKLVALVKEWGITWPVCLDPDGKVARAFKVTTLPKGFLIDQRGRLIAVYDGMAVKNKQDLFKRIDSLIPEINHYRIKGPAFFVGSFTDAEGGGDADAWRKKIAGWLSERGVKLLDVSAEADYVIIGNVAKMGDIVGVEVIISDSLGREETRLSDRVINGDDSRLKATLLESLLKFPYIPARK